MKNEFILIDDKVQVQQFRSAETGEVIDMEIHISTFSDNDFGNVTAGAVYFYDDFNNMILVQPIEYLNFG
jgi:hypothetical protein